jgi:hypothetical protein
VVLRKEVVVDVVELQVKIFFVVIDGRVSVAPVYNGKTVVIVVSLVSAS